MRSGRSDCMIRQTHEEAESLKALAAMAKAKKRWV